MTQLMSLGFSEREARLGLRACQGDIQEAAMHITNRRQVNPQCIQVNTQRRQVNTHADR